MTDPHKPLDAALEVLVYLPVGVAVTAVEEIPRLAAKGRQVVGGQVDIARIVGRFAVAQARARLIGGSQPTPAGRSAPGETRAGGSGDETSYASDGAWASTGVNGAAGPDGSVGHDPGGSGASAGNGRVEGPDRRERGHRDVQPVPPVDSLAIPGYDSLSASQVVQRLAGLSGEELAAVGTYESANRARRTVLTHVSQLQGS